MSHRDVLKEIMADAERDAASLDGRPFTGLAVGEMFGCVLASIKALAGIVLDEIDGLPSIKGDKPDLLKLAEAVNSEHRHMADNARFHQGSTFDQCPQFVCILAARILRDSGWPQMGTSP